METVKSLYFICLSIIQQIHYSVIVIFTDTIVEAKNGTGKTLTFVIPTLMKLKVDQSYLQAIILAPTREIAVQIQQCFKKVGQHLPSKKNFFFSKYLVFFELLNMIILIVNTNLNIFY